MGHTCGLNLVSLYTTSHEGNERTKPLYITGSGRSAHLFESFCGADPVMRKIYGCFLEIHNGFTLTRGTPRDSLWVEVTLSKSSQSRWRTKTNNIDLCFCMWIPCHVWERGTGHILKFCRRDGAIWRQRHTERDKGERDRGSQRENDWLMWPVRRHWSPWETLSPKWGCGLAFMVWKQWDCSTNLGGGGT